MEIIRTPYEVRLKTTLIISFSSQISEKKNVYLPFHSFNFRFRFRLRLGRRVYGDEQ